MLLNSFTGIDVNNKPTLVGFKQCPLIETTFRRGVFKNRSSLLAKLCKKPNIGLSAMFQPNPSLGLMVVPCRRVRSSDSDEEANYPN